jgi:ABC-type enterochelin transport system ATPase subunit
MMSFLEYLHAELVKPDLVQLEQGKINIDGHELSETESKDMIRRIGL